MIDGKLSLVLPAHNEAANIESVVARACHVLPNYADAFEIIIVDDGSMDGTGEIADDLAKRHAEVRVVHHQRNRGYGGALISGFDASTGDWVMWMDSDQQFDIADLIYLAPFIGEYDLVAGYRYRRSDPGYRVVYAEIFKLAVRILFGLNFRDIDCAFKVMRGNLLRSLKLESQGALISTELLAKTVRNGWTWTEVGVNHYPRAAGEQSGGSLRVVVRAMRDILALWYRINKTPRTVETRGAGGQPQGLSVKDAFTLLAVAVTALIAIVLWLTQRSR